VSRTNWHLIRDGEDTTVEVLYGKIVLCKNCGINIIPLFYVKSHHECKRPPFMLKVWFLDNNSRPRIRAPQKADRCQVLTNIPTSSIGRHRRKPWISFHVKWIQSIALYNYFVTSATNSNHRCVLFTIGTRNAARLTHCGLLLDSGRTSSAEVNRRSGCSLMRW
jgi:hypothetical protein